MIRWYVQGDLAKLDFATKIEAEAHARRLFPNETVSTRYARVFYREAEEPQTAPPPDPPHPRSMTMTLEVIQNIYLAQGHAHKAVAQSITTSLIGSRLSEDAKTTLRILAQAHLDTAHKMLAQSEQFKAA